MALFLALFQVFVEDLFVSCHLSETTTLPKFKEDIFNPSACHTLVFVA